MKIIIAGGRDFNNYNLLKSKVDYYLSKSLSSVNSIEIVSGNAKGADKLGEKYAKEKGYKLKLFPADWDKYGKQAGMLRNIEMAEYATHLIAFWDANSKGTKHMIKIAEENKLLIKIVKYGL